MMASRSLHAQPTACMAMPHTRLAGVQATACLLTTLVYLEETH